MSTIKKSNDVFVLNIRLNALKQQKKALLMLKKKHRIELPQIIDSMSRIKTWIKTLKS